MTQTAEEERAEWQLEWENYFDDIEDTLKLMDRLANKAIDEGLRNEDLICTLIEAGTALIRHCRICDEYLQTETKKIVSDIYRQNPIFALLEKTASTLAGEPDERPDDGNGVER